LNYAWLLGFAAVLLTMIPFLGAIVICVTALTLAFVQFGDWPHPALVLGVFAVVPRRLASLGHHYCRDDGHHTLGRYFGRNSRHPTGRRAARDPVPLRLETGQLKNSPGEAT
jgi:hypothetical protein